MRRKKKGQAAVEFLTTYGWAIMATLVAVGALYYFDVLDPDSFTTVKCETGPQLECLEAAIFENGDLQIRLRNNHNIRVYFDGIITINGQDLSMGNQDLLSGSSDTITIGGGSGFEKGDTHDAEIELNFGRALNSKPYTLRGTATLKVIPGSPP